MASKLVGLAFAFLAVVAFLFGVLAIAQAESVMHEILGVLSFVVAAVLIGVAVLCDLSGIVSKLAANKPEPPPTPPTNNGDTLELLKQIRAELTWQRQQKEKEIHREKAAASKRQPV